jgi:hypothetical protein
LRLVVTTISGHADWIPMIGLAFGVFLPPPLGETLTSEGKYTKIPMARPFHAARCVRCSLRLPGGGSKAWRTGTGVFTYDWISLSSTFVLAAIDLTRCENRFRLP